MTEQAPKLKYREVKLAIVSLLEGGKPMTPSMMIDKDPRLDQIKIGNAVRKMIASHDVLKIRRGLYMSPHYNAPSSSNIDGIYILIAQKKAAEKYANLIDFLRYPKTLDDVHQYLGLSRQGSGQKLKRLTKLGLVHRMPVSGKEFLYCSNLSFLSEDVERRGKAVTRRELSLLERLPLRGFAKVGDLPSLLNRSSNSINVDITNLVAKKLIVVEALGGSRYIRITDSGRSESAASNVIRLDSAEILDSFGRARGNIIRILTGLESACSTEIRYCLDRLVPLVDQVRVPQMIQHMQNHGLIQTSGRHGGKAKMRQLTAEGARIGHILAGHLPNPSRKELENWINEGRTADATRLAGLMVNRRLSERSLSILRLLESTEEGLTRKEIGHRLPLPYAREASVNQAVNSLELRGLVEREQETKGSKGSPLIFFLTEAGRRMLNDVTAGCHPA